MDKKRIFNDPIAPKERTSSRVFAAPTKEQATTGSFMDAGDNYGVGFVNPIGSKKSSSKSPIPQESKCFPSDQVL